MKSNKKLEAYLGHFVEGLAFFREWAGLGTPERVNLSHFFNPNSLLQALRLDFARKQGIEVDRVSLTVEPSNVATGDGLLLEGMYLEGAQWKDN